MFLSAVLCLAACDAGSDPATNLSAVADPAVDYAAKYADAVPTFDAQLNAVSLENPGFKGLIGSDDGTEVIVLVDKPVAQARGTSSALATDLVDRLGLDPSTLTFAEPAAA